VDAYVAGSLVTRVRLAIDTGASETVLTPGALRDCGLDPDLAMRHREVTTATRTEQAPVVTVPRFRALGQTVANLDVVCLSLPVALRLDGLLGLDFLGRFRLHLNLKRGVLVVQDPSPLSAYHRLAQILEVARAGW
jgi:predicted aspartyl protease